MALDPRNPLSHPNARRLSSTYGPAAVGILMTDSRWKRDLGVPEPDSRDRQPAHPRGHPHGHYPQTIHDQAPRFAVQSQTADDGGDQEQSHRPHQPTAKRDACAQPHLTTPQSSLRPRPSGTPSAVWHFRR
jgi:hypothetical protein